MADYFTDHGVFDLPDIGFEDLSVVCFLKKLSDGAEAELIVGSIALPEGSTLDDAVEHHFAVQASGRAGHAVLEKCVRRVADRLALDVSTRWFEGSRSMYQRQAHLVVDGEWVLVGMTSPLDERAACDEVMSHVLATFRPKGRARGA